MIKTTGYCASQAGNIRNMSILDQEGTSRLLDQVNEPYARGISSKYSSNMKLENFTHRDSFKFFEIDNHKNGIKSFTILNAEVDFISKPSVHTCLGHNISFFY